MINVSFAGRVDLARLAHDPATVDADSRMIAKRYAAVLTSLEARGVSPLLVFAGGNQSVDA